MKLYKEETLKELIANEVQKQGYSIKVNFEDVKNNWANRVVSVDHVSCDFSKVNIMDITNCMMITQTIVGKYVDYNYFSYTL